MFHVYILHLFAHKSAVQHLSVLKRHFIKKKDPTYLQAACIQESKMYIY